MLSSEYTYVFYCNENILTFFFQMIVIWHCDVNPPPSTRWPADLGVPILVKTRNIQVSDILSREDILKL